MVYNILLFFAIMFLGSPLLTGGSNILTMGLGIFLLSIWFVIYMNRRNCKKDETL